MPVPLKSKTHIATLVKKFHPDRNASPNAHEIIAQINAAYDILSIRRKEQHSTTAENGTSKPSLKKRIPEKFIDGNICKRKKEEAIRDQAKNEAALQRMYKGSWWMATAAMLFCLFLILDYHLPTLQVDEVAKYGTQERGPRSKYRQGDLISLMATEHFMFVVPHKVHLDYDYFADNKEALHIEATRMLKIPRNVSLNLKGQHVSFEVEDTICTRRTRVNCLRCGYFLRSSC